MPKDKEGKPETYVNPVYPHSFPDPFVLKFRGEYFAYCTGNAPDGNVFGIIRSRDLINWDEVRSAMRPLEPSPPYYWAPEVTYDNGKFYLYYSTGNEVLMEIRVAVSDRPDGDFVDAGVRLTQEEFAIDAHVFVDDDGTRYLFYATDFLGHSHIGTGTVVDRMIDWTTLAGKPRPVTRAKYDWQVYDPARKEKGGVRWYTVEGPTVLKRKGRYYEMFSGGNWQNTTYGVSFAVTDNINNEEEWRQFSDGDKVLPILRTIPDKVIGPGHNSVVRGPNNRELYCVYHRWTDAGRVMAIDRMDLAGTRIFVAGPTTTPQPAPFQPTSVTASLDGAVGVWNRGENSYVSAAEGECVLPLPLTSSAFLCEVSIKFVAWTAKSRAGFRLRTSGGACEFSIEPELGTARSRCENEKSAIGLPVGFDPSVDHLLRIEARGSECRVTLDTPNVSQTLTSSGDVKGLDFFSNDAAVEFATIELTGGFEELFEDRDAPPSEFEIDGTAECSAGTMLLSPSKNAQAKAVVAVAFRNFEVAANIGARGAKIGEYGLMLFDTSQAMAGKLAVATDKHTITFDAAGKSIEMDLPTAFDGREFRQFRIVRVGGVAGAYLDGILLAELPLDSKVARVAVFSDAQLAIDMFRITGIPD